MGWLRDREGGGGGGGAGLVGAELEGGGGLIICKKHLRGEVLGNWCLFYNYFDFEQNCME